jgi:signal transduction histidine kinase
MNPIIRRATIRKILQVCLCLLGIFLFLMPERVLAYARPVQVVKIGVFNYSNYAYQDKQGVWRGMDIECMINVAQHAGFRIEFVDSATDPAFLENLDKGVYDIVADVVKTPAREQKYLFSDMAQGVAYSTLAVRVTDARWEYGNVQQISQMKIGVLGTYFINDEFRKWCKERGLTPTIVEYRDIKTLAEALEKNEVDAEIYTAMYETEGLQKFRTILKFLPRDYFYAFRKNDVALKNSFDTALAQILLNNPYYLSDLQKKYANQFPAGVLLSNSEREYLANHRLVKVAMVEDNVPYYKVDDSGNFHGIVPEYFKLVSDKTGLKFQYDTYKTFEDAINAVKSGKADMMGTFTGGMIAANQSGVMLTDAFMTSNNMLLTKNGFEGKPKTIGIRHQSLDPARREMGQELVGVTLKEYNNVLACFQGFERGEVDGMVLSTPATTWILKQTNSANYNFKPLPSFEAEMCAAVSQDANDLRTIMNKGILATKSGLGSIVTANTQPENNWRTFIARMSPVAIAVITGVLLVLVLGLFWALFMLQRRQRERAAVLATQAETERQKLQVEALRKSTDERNQFFANISHDLRTPLNAIIGFSDLAGQQDDENVVKKYLNKINVAGKLMLDLINDTLTLSKLHSGKLDLKKEPLNEDVQILFAPVLESVQELAAAKRIELTVDSSKTLKRVIIGDKLNIQKVLLNLMTNAVKYTPAGGHIKVTFSNEKAPDGGIDSILTVADDGIGMAYDFQQSVFKPFSQESRPGYESNGTGLGLSIVKQLVDAMGGTISFVSAPNQGTTFTVKLRFTEAPAGTQVTDAQAEHNKLDVLSGRRLLLCEDNQMNREIACALLHSQGLLVDVAANGQEGVQAFSDSEPGTYAAILMDLRMPVLTGYEATKQIRSLERTDAKTIPIIAMTADAFADDIKACFDVGMNDHVAKPIDPQNLFATLAKYM